jgi:apolipoprotein N-acyltransferase
MKALKFLGLAILSGLLLGTAWFPPFTWVIFIAFVPLLILTGQIESSTIKRKKFVVFLLAYLTFLIWNSLDTWWIWFASDGGAIAAIVANSLLMALTYLLYFTLRRRIQNSVYSIWILIPVWLSFEYLHTKWDLAWTWLTLGNVFAFEHNWVQWYEFTGVSGGTAWIFVVNIILYQIIQAKLQESKIRLAAVALILLIPIGISQILIHTSSLQTNSATDQQVLIVQPNIDPYNDKFNGDFQGQLQGVYNKIKNKITPKTKYVALPETFLTESLWENNIENSYSIKFLKDSLLAKFPDLTIVIGATTFYQYSKDEKLSVTARAFDNNAEIYYDVYNTAIQLNKTGIQLYHKSKLVPGVERMPYPALFKPLEELAINLGGTFGSLGTQDTRDVFFNADKSIGVAPVVCYESIFGEYVGDYINNGANLIFIITNDGWWRDTPGYKQHLAYARLRAIETRRQIARSANTGISCVVDELGNLHAEQAWWKEGYIMANLTPNNQKTFFVRFGDMLSKLASVLVVLIIGYSIFLGFKKPNNS